MNNSDSTQTTPLSKELHGEEAMAHFSKIYPIENPEEKGSAHTSGVSTAESSLSEPANVREKIKARVYFTDTPENATPSSNVVHKNS